MNYCNLDIPAKTRPGAEKASRECAVVPPVSRSTTGLPLVVRQGLRDRSRRKPVSRSGAARRRPENSLCEHFASMGPSGA